MSEQITHYTPCCATCRHAEAGGPCAWRHDNADGDCCPDWEYGNHAAWLGDDTPYPMASREITAEPHGSMEEHTALCEHTRVESLPDRRKQLPHHVMVLHSQKGLLAAAALAYRYGKELHPAGTAAKLQELAKERDEAEVVRSDQRLLAENAELRREAAENAADKKESLKCIRTLSESISRVRRGRIDYDRVRAEVPECEGLTDGQIDWIANTMTARGREVLAAIEACRVTEAEPIGYSLRALLGLAWEYVHDARAGSSFLDAARAEGLLVGAYGERKPTDLGRKTWTDFLRRLGLPGDGSKPEPEPDKGGRQ